MFGTRDLRILPSIFLHLQNCAPNRPARPVPAKATFRPQHCMHSASQRIVRRAQCTAIGAFARTTLLELERLHFAVAKPKHGEKLELILDKVIVIHRALKKFQKFSLLCFFCVLYQTAKLWILS